MREWMAYIERMVKEAKRGAASVNSGVVARIEDIVETGAADAARHPTAPIELTWQTGSYLNGENKSRVQFTMDFPDVTKSTDAKNIAISHYELWGYDETYPLLQDQGSAYPALIAPGSTLPGAYIAPGTTNERVWMLLSASETSRFLVRDFVPNSLWRFKVRAIGVNLTVPGNWSVELPVQMLEDTGAPGQPTAPVVTVNRGTIKVSWDGQSVNGPMPADFRFAVLARGTASSPTETAVIWDRNGGFMIFDDTEYYRTEFFRIQAVDYAGNTSPWSEQATAYTTPLVDEDIILSELDAAKTHLKNVNAGVSILPDTIITEHLRVTEDMMAALAQFLVVKAGMIEANSIDVDKLAAGAVTAEKLEAVLALLTKIIAGDPNGNHAAMTPEGFFVYAQDLLDGIPNEAVRLGSGSDEDYLALTDPATGLATAAISGQGDAVFRDVNIRRELWYRGETLTTVIKRLAGGIVGWGAQYSNSPAAGPASQMGIFEIAVYLEAGRLYEITTSNVRLYSNEGGNKSFLRVRWTANSNGPAPYPGVGSPIIAQAETNFATEGYSQVNIQKIANVAVSANYRFLLAFSCEKGGTAATQAIGSNEFPIELVFKDIGPYTGNLQQASTGGSSGAQAPQARTLTRISNGVRSYDGANNFYNYNPGYMYQGQSPGGFGNLKSIATFPDMTAELSGATINYIRVTFRFVHWFNNAGGTARIGVHGWTAVPGTFSSTGVSGTPVESAGWPRGGVRTVDLPASTFAGFKSGSLRGVTLEGAGNYETYGYAEMPSIEVGYSK